MNGEIMSRLVPFLLVSAALLVAQGSRGDVPANDNNSPEAALPVGKWNVEFTNGVTEVCVIGNGGWAVVDEPQRRSRGTVVVKGGSVVMTFNDDRIERWTSVGKRFVVEHWFPGSQFPTATPVLGIAERTKRGRWQS
jgi:hypothetical protein